MPTSARMKRRTVPRADMGIGPYGRYHKLPNIPELEIVLAMGEGVL